MAVSDEQHSIQIVERPKNEKYLKRRQSNTLPSLHLINVFFGKRVRNTTSIPAYHLDLRRSLYVLILCYLLYILLLLLFHCIIYILYISITLSPHILSVMYIVCALLII